MDDIKYKYADFETVIGKLVVKHAQKQLHESPGVLKQKVNDMFGIDAQENQIANLSQKEQKIYDICFGFFEVDYSYSRLCDYSVLVGRFPFTKSSITKERYLAFVLEGYFQEIYILEARLIRFLNILKKSYKSDVKYPVLIKATKRARDLVKQYFEPLSKIRSEHVHETRLREPEIHRLDGLKLLMENWDDKESLPYLKFIYDNKYRSCRAKWKKDIKSRNEDILRLLDIIFGYLYLNCVKIDEAELIEPEVL